MVQVDIFWSYALGASFSAAACRQLKDEKKPFQTSYFTYTLLYLSCIFAPSGIYLLWQFPHWETMQVATCHGDIPSWLVVIFAVTNITQGILGFWVGSYFARKGQYFNAHLQWIIGYFFMFFILLFGWDSTGWQRFLYDPTVNNGVLWTKGTHLGFCFIISNVAITLYIMGIFVLPFLIIPMVKWIIEGIQADTTLNEIPPNNISIVNSILLGIIIAGFGSAAIASIIIYIISLVLKSYIWGILIGMVLYVIISYFIFFQKDQIGYTICKKIFIQEFRC